MFNFLRDNFAYTPHKPKPSQSRATRLDIIKIELIDHPTKLEKGEGTYLIRYLDDRFFMDIHDCMRYLEKNVHIGISVHVMDRLQNFKKVYVNKVTGEIHTW